MDGYFPCLSIADKFEKNRTRLPSQSRGTGRQVANRHKYNYLPLPGSLGACKDCLGRILIYQLDYSAQPCNFVEFIAADWNEHYERSRPSSTMILYDVFSRHRKVHASIFVLFVLFLHIIFEDMEKQEHPKFIRYRTLPALVWPV